MKHAKTFVGTRPDVFCVLDWTFWDTNKLIMMVHVTDLDSRRILVYNFRTEKFKEMTGRAATVGHWVEEIVRASDLLFLVPSRLTSRHCISAVSFLGHGRVMSRESTPVMSRCFFHERNIASRS